MRLRLHLFIPCIVALPAMPVSWNSAGIGAPPVIAQSAAPEKQAANSGNPVFFEDIKPLLDRNCTGCHAWAKTTANLVGKKSDVSPTKGLRIVYPSKPDSSVIIWRLEGKLPSGKAIVSMPKGRKKLDDTSISLVRTWIAQGTKERSPEKKK
ncbi:MAG: c-type cytochrome [Candidatus Latescibacterota bacterium]